MSWLGKLRKVLTYLPFASSTAAALGRVWRIARGKDRTPTREDARRRAEQRREELRSRDR